MLFRLLFSIIEIKVDIVWFCISVNLINFSYSNPILVIDDDDNDDDDDDNLLVLLSNLNLFSFDVSKIISSYIINVFQKKYVLLYYLLYEHVQPLLLLLITLQLILKYNQYHDIYYYYY